MSDQHNMRHVNVMGWRFTIFAKQLVTIDCTQFQSKHSHGYHFEHAYTQKTLKVCRKFKWENVHESLKMNVTELSGCLQRDVVNKM